MTDGAATESALARNQAARRRRVIEATLNLAGQGGFDAVQMRDVAAEAGVALGTVYRYFESKERLLLEANVEQVEELGARLAERPPVGELPGGSRRRGAATREPSVDPPAGGDRRDGAGAGLRAARARPTRCAGSARR